MSISFVDSERHLYPYSGIYKGGLIGGWVLRMGLGCQVMVSVCLYYTIIYILAYGSFSTLKQGEYMTFYSL